MYDSDRAVNCEQPQLVPQQEALALLYELNVGIGGLHVAAGTTTTDGYWEVETTPRDAPMQLLACSLQLSLTSVQLSQSWTKSVSNG